MHDAERSLLNCFSAVFPELSEAEIRRASVTSVAAWYSLATITLVSVIEEEFALQIEPSDLENMVSFELILEHLKTKTAAYAS